LERRIFRTGARGRGKSIKIIEKPRQNKHIQQPPGEVSRGQAAKGGTRNREREGEEGTKQSGKQRENNCKAKQYTGKNKQGAWN